MNVPYLQKHSDNFNFRQKKSLKLKVSEIFKYKEILSIWNMHRTIKCLCNSKAVSYLDGANSRWDTASDTCNGLIKIVLLSVHKCMKSFTDVASV